MDLVLKVKRLTNTATLPTKANEFDAGFDLYADENYEIDSNETILISTGIAMEMPDGYVGLIWDRSSIGVRGVHRFGGVIDSGYRGEVKVCLSNVTHGKNVWPYYVQRFHISRGDKIAQILIQEMPNFRVEEVKKLSESGRGESGFGSSGK